MRSSENLPLEILDLYVADYGNSTVRKVVIATGAVSTVAGVAGQTSDASGELAAPTYLNHPMGILYTSAGLFVGNETNIRLIH